MGVTCKVQEHCLYYCSLSLSLYIYIYIVHIHVQYILHTVHTTYATYYIRYIRTTYGTYYIRYILHTIHTTYSMYCACHDHHTVQVVMHTHVCLCTSINVQYHQQRVAEGQVNFGHK